MNDDRTGRIPPANPGPAPLPDKDDAAAGRDRAQEPAAAPPPRILVADDEESMRYFLGRALERHGFEVEVVEDGAAAIERFEAHPFDIAVLDLKMPGADGIEVLARIRALDPDAMAIVMTAYGTVPSAVEAMRRGAFDYITKPFEVDELLLLLQRALGQRATLNENRTLRQLVDGRADYGGLIGQSAAIRSIYQTIDLLRSSSATVLITGESGTGKELVARAIHVHSAFAGGQFVPLNCAAVPETLFESEMFGHEEGAFTGAAKRRRGLIERARGGTLFLDEISEIRPHAQAKLVRFLQERRVTPLGSNESHEVSLRIIAASNQDLEAEVARGGFRQDLFWRLNVVPIHLPPLRERREDVPVLAAHFLDRHARLARSRVKGLSVEAMIALSSHPWHGNVRELENTIERMVVLHCDKELLDLSDLPSQIGGGAPAATPEDRPESGFELFADALQRFERDYFRRLFAETRGNVSQAARLSGLSRPNLHRKAKQCDVDPDRFRK